MQIVTQRALNRLSNKTSRLQRKRNRSFLQIRPMLASVSLRGRTIPTDGFNGLRFHQVDFRNTIWDDSSGVDGIENSNLWGCDLRGVQATGVAIRGCRLLGCQLEQANLRDCDLGKTVFDGCDLRGAYFQWASCQGTVFINCQFRNAFLSESRISEAVFVNCNLGGTVLDPEAATTGDYSDFDVFNPQGDTLVGYVSPEVDSRSRCAVSSVFSVCPRSVNHPGILIRHAADKMFSKKVLVNVKDLQQIDTEVYADRQIFRCRAVQFAP